eukprot:5452615-Prymnesium_polylepis.1
MCWRALRAALVEVCVLSQGKYSTHISATAGHAPALPWHSHAFARPPWCVGSKRSLHGVRGSSINPWHA